MEKEIQELIINSIKNGQGFGKDFYNEIINIYIKHKDLKDYLNSTVEIRQTRENHIAQYHPQEKQIVMSTNGINNYLQKIQTNYSEAFNQDTLLKYLSLQITQFLLHELEHVDQEKKISEKDTSLEGKLLTETNMDMDYVLDQAFKNARCAEDVDRFMESKIDIFREAYKRNYAKVLRERLSQLRSLKRVIKATQSLDLHQNVSTMFNSQLVDEKLKGYELNGFYSTGPTIDYIDGLVQSNLVNPENSEFYDENKVKAFVELSQKYSLEDRIEYGLPINANEYQEIETERPKGLIRI